MENNKLIESFTDWSKFDANYEIYERTGGVTKEHIEMEVDLFDKQLKLLKPLNYNEIFSEIQSWDLSLPKVFNSNELSKVYSRNAQYKLRVSYLLAQAKDWCEICETACKYLEELSLGAFTGTANDKKSSSKLIIKPFVHLKLHTSRIENLLKEINNCITFNTDRINAIVIQKQSEAKLNYKLIQDGEYISNSVYEDDSVEDDEDIFLPVPKKNRTK